MVFELGNHICGEGTKVKSKFSSLFSWVWYLKKYDSGMKINLFLNPALRQRMILAKLPVTKGLILKASVHLTKDRYRCQIEEILWMSKKLMTDEVLLNSSE